MCLAVPGKVVEWIDREPPFARALVEFGGIRRDINMACLPEVDIGDYVIAHAGIAISQMDIEEAEQVFELLDAGGFFHPEESSGNLGKGPGDSGPSETQDDLNRGNHREIC